MSNGSIASKPRIVLVDDDARLLTSLARGLEFRGFEVVAVASAGEALPYLRLEPPDVAVLDVSMPGMDGIAFCSLIRQEMAVPVLFLTARDELSDKVAGFEAGADDYLAKPFALDELVLRIKALLRRSAGNTPASRSLRVGQIELDRSAWLASLDGQDLKLTTTEFLLLERLMTEPGRVFTRDELLNAAWQGESSNVESNAVDVHISNLRQKLELAGGGLKIRTVRRVGYGLQPEAR